MAKSVDRHPGWSGKRIVNGIVVGVAGKNIITVWLRHVSDLDGLRGDIRSAVRGEDLDREGLERPSAARISSGNPNEIAADLRAGRVPKNSTRKAVNDHPGRF